MFQNLLLNKDCWLAHMSLDQSSGMDPPNIKLRPACGMGAADYLIGDYWYATTECVLHEVMAKLLIKSV
jgi:phospholipid:diacylglycerol acyltransferase